MNRISSILEGLLESRTVLETGTLYGNPVYLEKDKYGWIIQKVSGAKISDDSSGWARNTDLEKAFIKKFGKDLESIGKNPKVETSFHFYSGLSRDSLDDARFIVTFDSFNDEESKKFESFKNIFSEYDFIKFDKHSIGNKRVLFVRGYRGLTKFSRVLGIKVRYPETKRKETEYVD